MAHSESVKLASVFPFSFGRKVKRIVNCIREEGFVDRSARKKVLSSYSIERRNCVREERASQVK